jgi:hypothetical protein
MRSTWVIMTLFVHDDPGATGGVVYFCKDRKSLIKIYRVADLSMVAEST